MIALKLSSKRDAPAFSKRSSSRLTNRLGEGVMFESEPENALPSGCRVDGRLVRSLWSTPTRRMAIYAPDDGASPLFLIVEYPDGGIVRLAEFDSFAAAYRF